MSRLAHAAGALAAVMRSQNLRRVELAWGASIAAEWAHFVALGVFAYGAGGTSAVGFAGLARVLPPALVAPLASSLGDRLPRERFLPAIALVGPVALAAAAGAMLVAAGLLASVTVEGRIQPGPPEVGARRLVLDGLRAVAHSPKPRLIMILMGAQGFVRGCLNVLIVVAVFRVLHAHDG